MFGARAKLRPDLGVCRILKGVKNLFKSNDLPCLLVDGFPHNTIRLHVASTASWVSPLSFTRCLLLVLDAHAHWNTRNLFSKYRVPCDPGNHPFSQLGLDLVFAEDMLINLFIDIVAQRRHVSRLAKFVLAGCVQRACFNANSNIKQIYGGDADGYATVK